MSAEKKLIAWMLKGSYEYNELLRYFDNDLLQAAIGPAYKPIVVEIQEYYSKHKITPSTDVLIQILHESGQLNSISTLKSSMKEDMSLSELGFYSDKVKEKYNNFLLTSIKKKTEEVLDGESELTIEDLNKELRKVVTITEKLYKKDAFSEGELAKSTADRINHYNHVVENPEEIKGFLSGYKELDDYTWGVKNSEMLVIGGASSSGKSLLMLNMAINAWRGSNDPAQDIIGFDDGKNVIYVSLEMSKLQLEQRIDANLANLKHKEIMRGLLSDADLAAYKNCLQFQKTYDKVFYILDMPRGTTMGEIDAKFETICGMFKPDAIFIDYLQLMKPTINASGTDWLDVGKVSEELHEFCRKKNIPVVTAAQRKASGKKKVEKGREKEEDNEDDVDLEDFGRSKMIGDNAAIAFMIGKRKNEILREDMPIYIVKNRDGAKGTVYLKKTFDKSRIESLPNNWTSDDGGENAI